jgi:hypothetical protein
VFLVQEILSNFIYIVMDLFFDDQVRRDNDEDEGSILIRCRPLFEYDACENGKRGEADDLLNDLELGHRENVVPDPVGGHLEAIFKQGNAPAHEYDQGSKGCSCTSSDHTKPCS